MNEVYTMNCNENQLEIEEKYRKAQRLMQGIWSKNLVLNSLVIPTWIEGSDIFWYQRETRSGREYRLVNAKLATNTCAFDHCALASALSEVVHQDLDPYDLGINDVEIQLDPLRVYFSFDNQDWLYEVTSDTCVEIKTQPKDCAISPNGKFAVLRHGFNLWLRDLETGEETSLTEDGEECNVYGAVSTAWGQPLTPASVIQVCWSPDSNKIFCVQRDTRQVKTLPVVHHVPQDGTMRPTIEYRKIAYPGDDDIEMLRLLVIDRVTGCINPVQYRLIPVTRNSQGFFTAGLGWWAADSYSAYFLDMDRYYKKVRLIKLDAQSGATQILFEESSETQLNLSPNADEEPMLTPLPETDELLWFSERSGWGHLYLYDLKTGKLKHPVTKGDWVVRNIVFYDAKRREVFVQTAGRVPERDPYYRDVVRIHIDTGVIKTIVSSNHEYTAFSQHNHNTRFLKLIRDVNDRACSISSTGNFSVVTQSRADEVPISLLLDRDGKIILKLEKADISDLFSTVSENWRWPEPVKLLAADGKTDIYGLIYRPSDFSPENSYPVIDFTINLADFPGVPKGSFCNGVLLDWVYFGAAALAELGFIVVQIDGRGVSCRSKAFQDESYGNIYSANDIADHVAGIRQLADRFSYIDLKRVGITTHMTDGSGAVSGLLEHPDFYKVGVNFGLFDNRLMSSSMWDHKYGGASHKPIGHQFLEDIAGNLCGKLLLMHGMLDLSCPPAAVFRLIDAFQRANKDFDVLLLPNIGHDSPSDYLTRRAWDYFVTHLQNVAPPKGFRLVSSFGLENQ